MFIRRHPELWIFVPVICVVCSGIGCPFGFGPQTGGGATSQPREIFLRIINESGVDAAASATFYVGTTAVRETSRFLPAAGVESTSLVVPTMTERIHVVASEAAAQPAARVGDVLADEEITIGPDVLPGDSITFTISPRVFADCNNNGINDAQDIAAGTSVDCNLNGIPDECESPTPVVVVIGEIQAILQSDQDGATRSTLVDFTSYGLGSLRKLDVDAAAAYIYFTQSLGASADTVDRIPLAGGTPVALVPSQDMIGGIGLDLAGGRMYWTSYIMTPTGNRIASALFDGSNISNVVFRLTNSVLKPCVDSLNGKVYYTSVPASGPATIQWADLSGANIATIIPNAADPRDVDVWPEANLLVWADYGASGGIFTADLHGNNATRIALVPVATGVAIDRSNCRLYWTSEGSFGFRNGYVERANLDGSGVQRIVSGLDAPQDVAVYTAR
ncbi:MAG TPA: hypothetical protein VMV94_03235 [Phycisphaerae bacterium]|nr:hypothetical protein [Phycisphaerae bacterium]